VDQPVQSRRNRLLELLNAHDFDRLRPHLEEVPFDYRLPLYQANKPIHFVYFPITGVASVVTTMSDGREAEVGTIGNEGMVGLPVVLGDNLASTSVYVQVPGAGMRLAASAFRTALEQSSTMRLVMQNYAQVMFNQVAQSAACAHFHHIEQRCCRWLLMTHDRVQSETFLLTQEFLGMMLGVRRTSVTLAANSLKKKKLIEYSRGHVTILDRAGLERHSCECYGVTKREFDRLLGAPSGLVR
jgi:CRP-like cAMP-binding protein